MMRVIGLIVGAVMVMLLVAVGFANAGIDQAGTTAANFLSLGSGARQLGMGGAAIGLGDDLGSTPWNVAALGYVNRTEVVFSHSSLGDGTNQEWAGVGGRLKGGSTRWSVSGLYQGSGSFEGRDASNLPTADFSVSSFAFGAHLAHRFGDVLSIGAGSKIVTENLGTVSGHGITFDFGATAHAAGFGFGLAAQNMGGQMHYDGMPFRFPGNVGAGVSYALPMTGLRLAVDANFPMAYYSDVRVGAEYLWHDVLAIRGGYRHEMSDGGEDPLSGPTFGLGAGWNGIWMDYGYLVSSTGEAQHRLGFRLFPGHGGSGGGSYGQTDQPSIAPPAPAPKRTTMVASKPAEKKPVSVAPAEPKTAPATTPATASKPATTSTTPSTKTASTETKAVVPVTKPATETKAVVPAAKPATPVVSAPKSATATSVKPAETTAKPAAKPVDAAPKSTTASVTKPADAASGPVAVVAPITKPAAPATKPVAKPAEAAKPTPAKETAKPDDAQAKASDDAKSTEAPKVTEEKPADAPKPAEVKPAPKEAPAASAAPSEKPGAKTKPRPSKIKVGSNDTLASIAKQWNVSAASIMMENDLTNDKVHAGQTLKLPAAGR